MTILRSSKASPKGTLVWPPARQGAASSARIAWMGARSWHLTKNFQIIFEVFSFSKLTDTWFAPKGQKVYLARFTAPELTIHWDVPPGGEQIRKNFWTKTNLRDRHDICQLFYTSRFSKIKKIRKSVPFQIPNIEFLSFLLIELECYPNLHICILSLYLSLITPNSKKYNLKLYPIGTNFTLALLVLLVTNLASEFLGKLYYIVILMGQIILILLAIKKLRRQILLGSFF